ncbi:MAG TPA: GAF domain-containing protein [Nakamurella sp.]|nr:GAF domain-containing protein [Nakamurella sp.]
MEIDTAALARSLDELTSGLTTIDSAEPLTSRLAVTLAAARDVLQVDCVGLLLLDAAGALRTVASTGPGADSLERAEEDLGVGPGVDALRTAAPVVVDDLAAIPSYAQLWDLVADDGVRAVVCSPVRSGGEVVGTLSVTLPQTHHWAPREVAAIGAFAEVTGTLLALIARSAPPLLLDPSARARADGRSPVTASDGEVGDAG